jgi:hypothetical protein
MTKAHVVLIAVMMALGVSFGVHRINPFSTHSTPQKIAVTKPDSIIPGHNGSHCTIRWVLKNRVFQKKHSIMPGLVFKK